MAAPTVVLGGTVGARVAVTVMATPAPIPVRMVMATRAPIALPPVPIALPMQPVAVPDARVAVLQARRMMALLGMTTPLPKTKADGRVLCHSPRLIELMRAQPQPRLYRQGGV